MALKVKAVERLVKFNKNEAGRYLYVMQPELYAPPCPTEGNPRGCPAQQGCRGRERLHVLIANMVNSFIRSRFSGLDLFSSQLSVRTCFYFAKVDTSYVQQWETLCQYCSRSSHNVVAVIGFVNLCRHGLLFECAERVEKK